MGLNSSILEKMSGSSCKIQLVFFVRFLAFSQLVKCKDYANMFAKVKLAVNSDIWLDDRLVNWNFMTLQSEVFIVID